MTEEQVWKAKALVDKIKSLKYDIDIISQSESINKIEFHYKDNRSDVYNYFGFDKKEFINFEVFRTIILASLNKELERCQKELNLL